MPFHTTERNVSQKFVWKLKIAEKGFGLLNFFNENDKTPQSNRCGSNSSTFLREQEGAIIEILESEGLKCHLLCYFQERE